MVIEVGERGYSQRTPGSDFDMLCRMNQWTYVRYSTEDHYRECVLAAKNCKYFEERT